MPDLPKTEQNDFLHQMEQRAVLVEEILKEFLPKDPSHNETLRKAMEYSVLGGGKRIRPVIIRETFRMYGGEQEELVKPFMAAMEMIHSYSLVHDDLPAMDNDEYRRGRKTTHAVFGDGMAVLAGDGLLNLAYETAVSAFEACKDSDETGNVIRALRVLSRKAGVYGMVGGQSLDVEADKKALVLNAEQLHYVYENKTAALLEGAFMIGAALAGAPDEDLALLEQVGSYVGLAFQIQDDILDITSTLEELGKPIGSDDKNGKSTYVTIHGLEQSAAKAKELNEKACSLLHSLGKEDAFLRELIQNLTGRRK